MIKKDEPMFASLAVLPRQLTYSRSWYALSGRNSSVDEMATCVSEIAPRESLAPLKTTPYGNDEGAAFATLGPNLVSCLQAGYKVTGNRQSLRAAIADALYQRVANPAAAVASPSRSEDNSNVVLVLVLVPRARSYYELYCNAPSHKCNKTATDSLPNCYPPALHLFCRSA